MTSSLTLYEILMIIAGLTGKNLRDKKFVEEVVELHNTHQRLDD